MTDAANLLPDDVRERLARAMHDDYLRHQRERGIAPGSDAAMVGWDELPETLKRSNRDQARDVGVKLAAIGCEVAPLDGRDAEPFSFTPDELERLSRMEHERWRRDREADDWTLGPEKDVERRTSPHLVAWDELPEEIREYDRDMVRGLPAFLAAAGMRIVRPSQEGTSP